ncbi:uncharacterized protein STEHIDRAFT_162456 [Stereum hirsutum FP-91666 SS1]|uniref:uncharacterized protein n=1 Tax=Stereum hirsutum (strain FP-91666) TaxID=721885 RepID=UPI0004449C2A|nr:uncharacterized protein STEHIDRAFT_162456 [Stereum hirsutum FP-91666 SS1]EIM80678.1 hypothetical protein STEHIDRAFT_162456 [Stereum hirsutum FP-91666 SS1]
MTSPPREKALPLFYPEIDPLRLRYTEADRIRLFRSQPLNRIGKYLIPKPADVAVLLPPLLHLGWIVDKEAMFEHALEQGVNCTISDDKGHRRNYYAACNEGLLCFLEDLDLSFDDRNDVVNVCDGDYELNSTEARKNFQLAVTIGTNYDRLIPKEAAARIQDFVAPGVKPRWFLDQDKWVWTKAPGLDKLREKYKQERALADSVNNSEPDKSGDTNVSL